MQAKHHTLWATALARLGLAAIALAAEAGCSSPLTTVALREFLRESTMTLAIDGDAEEASKPDVDSKGSAPKSGDEEADAGPADAAGEESSGEDAPEDLSVDARIERSLERLARTSGFDQVARDVLVETLEKAAPEDWPSIIDSFAASLETSPPRNASNSAAVPAAADAAPQPVAKPSGGLTSPVAASVTLEPQREEPSAEEVEEPRPPETVQQDDAVQQEDPAVVVAMLKERLAEARRSAPLTVRRACFASKVRGWGNLDAFEEPRFVPGQDVLVYVELDNLDGVEGPRGFSTRVAATLRLVDAAGDVVAEWSFPAVEDRADSPRTDYFVRYVVRIPADATAGLHRLEATITDAVSSKVVKTGLPLEVISADGSLAR